MVSIVENIYPEKDVVMQFHIQDVSITSNVMVKLDFTLPALSAPDVLTWKCHVVDSAKGGYDMILG